MNINIKRGELPIKEARKYKLKNILKEEKEEKICYHWKLTSESAEETIKDFHLFCISIARDLVRNDFKTNEHGKIEYEMEKLYKDETLNYLNNLYDIIKKTIK